MKHVRETTAGKSISAYVILNPKGEHVATVQSHYANGGTVTVDVWNIGDKATLKTALAMGYSVDEKGHLIDAKGVNMGLYPYCVAGLQQGRAGGGGYDKFTAALRGAVIDGHKMTDHCGESRKPPKGRKTWPRDAKAPKGFRFANWIDGSRKAHDGSRMYPHIPEGESGYASCYRESGLEYLKAIGYRVIQAI